ncbi:LysR family transcriptional regulator [Rhodoferax sp. PAMC 29310]|uniref:LysR family transcriptional regulator n=1 Tax=Rhodoferax sp. PAMC 29310 TaxID=2822760 RepID=UPI001F0ACB2B|nr:LysR family transcriptional regulator [Rhodoferax sp. PAMC 29310]
MSRQIDFKTLQCFATVAEVGNVTRAADVLHMTQPALSLRLQQLGEQTGLKLFTRTAKGLDLTADGLALHVKATQVLNAMGDLQRTIHHMHGHVRGKLRIGTVIDPEFTRLGAFLSGLVEAAPMLGKELRQGMSGNVADWILHDIVDAGFFLGPLPATVSNDPVFFQKMLTQFSYRVIAPPGWESRVVDKSWEALAPLPWVGTVAESVHHRLLKTVFAPLGTSPNYVAMVDQESSMLAMVRSGVGLSLSRDSVALAEKHRNGVVVNSTLEIPCSLSFISLAERRQEPGIACAFDVLRHIWSGSE